MKISLFRDRIMNVSRVIILLCLILPAFAFAQIAAKQPKLIIGIVVDQMRYDFLYRYANQYGEDGFARLINEGFSCENTHYNYIPTYTGPGHAAIYTGTTPAVNGIIGNTWITPAGEKYVTSDPTVKSVGIEANKTVGQHSPRVLLSSTITDELKLFNNERSKVVGVCLKDRGSILPAGHLADACYWFEDSTGNWITSTYYTRKQADSTALPAWVTQYNNLKLPEKMLNKPWEKLSDDPYVESIGAEWKQYEEATYQFFPGDFPYTLNGLSKPKEKYKVLRFTPAGNTLTTDFAMETIRRMNLGRDEYTDFMCLSFSGTDYCGHQFGIHAEEVQDVYMSLDAELARLLQFVDKEFGKDNVLLFLTADHGVAETPEHLRSLGMDVGVFEQSKLAENLDLLLQKLFIDKAFPNKKMGFIMGVDNQQIWFNGKVTANMSQNDRDRMEKAVMTYIRSLKGVYQVWTKNEVTQLPESYPFAPELRRGIHPRLSGDIIFQLDPAWHSDDGSFKTDGTTHGSGYAYDTHVPLIWYGWNIRQGETFEPVSITDIAPTLAAMLRIMEPNGTTGKVIPAVLRR